MEQYGYEEHLAPIVDTALHQIGDRWLPVHILDDDKLSVQDLLGKHPLLLPICREPSPDTILHFIVVGDSRTCQWLAREALWMMTLRDKSIHTKITLVGPHAEEALETLFFLCPGLRREQMIQTELSACSCPVSYFALTRIVSASIQEGHSVYLAVDEGSDTENLDTAIRLREETVCSLSWIGVVKPELPVIAFRCRDPEIASLSRSSVVVNENSGLGWYNNYNLIPFGENKRYAWDELTDNILEKMSLCFHLAYSGFFPEDMRNPKKANELNAIMKDYYTRTYNRDSSMAAALSMPYRMLQIIPGEKTFLFLNNQSIQDSDLFSTEENRHVLSQSIGNLFCTEESFNAWSETQLLSEWEHERWCSYMISRGWVSVSPEEAAAYCKAGNPRQQLYIGRMHPCITPYSKLESLEKYIRTTVGIDENFRRISRISIERTLDILRLSWL